MTEKTLDENLARLYGVPLEGEGTTWEYVDRRRPQGDV